VTTTYPHLLLTTDVGKEILSLPKQHKVLVFSISQPEVGAAPPPELPIILPRHPRSGK
jgi:hypothetical protein